jgi:hypothetical protein
LEYTRDLTSRILDGEGFEPPHLALEDLRQRDFEARQQGSYEDVSRGCGEQRPAPESSVGLFPDLSGLAGGIEDPVFAGSEPFVGLTLEDLVQAAGGVGEDFDDEVRCALDVLLRDDGRPL